MCERKLSTATNPIFHFCLNVRLIKLVVKFGVDDDFECQDSKIINLFLKCTFQTLTPAREQKDVAFHMSGDSIS